MLPFRSPKHRTSSSKKQFWPVSYAMQASINIACRIHRPIDYANRNLRRELSVEELADAAGLSPRQFSRAFKEETGQSPAKAVENLRVEAARLLMEQGRHSMDVIADETGFGDRERMRRAFLRTLGQPPQAIRRRPTVTPKSWRSPGRR